MNSVNDEVIDEVIDGIFIGNLQAANNNVLLNHHNITCIISIGCSINHIPPNMNVISFVNVEDNPNCLIIRLLILTCNILQNCHKNGLKTLVHCVQGQSRSAVAICYYLFKKFCIMLEDKTKLQILQHSLDFLESRHPNICINPGFLSQLYLLSLHSSSFEMRMLCYKNESECCLIPSVIWISNSRVAEDEVIDKSLISSLKMDYQNDDPLEYMVLCHSCKTTLFDNRYILKEVADSGSFVNINMPEFWDHFAKLSTKRYVMFPTKNIITTVISDWILKQAEVNPGANVPLLCPQCNQSIGLFKMSGLILCGGYLASNFVEISSNAVTFSKTRVRKLFT